MQSVPACRDGFGIQVASDWLSGSVALRQCFADSHPRNATRKRVADSASTAVSADTHHAVSSKCGRKMSRDSKIVTEPSSDVREQVQMVDEQVW